MSDLPAGSPLPAGLALSQDTQARLARVPLPHHLANATTLPHHLTANHGQPLNHHLANATTLPHHQLATNASNQLGSNLVTTASPQFSSSTSPTRWRISPTRLENPSRSDSSRLDQTQLTPSPTPAACSPLPSHSTSPSRRASDHGGGPVRSGRAEPDISPSHRSQPAPPPESGAGLREVHLENHQAELINSRLAPSGSR